MDYCPPPSAVYIEYSKKEPKNFTPLEQIKYFLIKKNILFDEIFVSPEVKNFAQKYGLSIFGIHEIFNGFRPTQKFKGKYTAYEAYRPKEQQVYYILADDKEVRLATPREIKRIQNCPYF